MRGAEQTVELSQCDSVPQSGLLVVAVWTTISLIRSIEWAAWRQRRRVTAIADRFNHAPGIKVAAHRCGSVR